MHAGKSGGSFDGFFGRIMRRVLQLRTSQGQPDNDSQLAGVKGEIKLGSAPPKIRFREPQIEMAPGVEINPQWVRPGDKLLLSGPIGDHGITILLARGDLDMEGDLESDTRSVFPLVEAVVAVAGAGIRWMRDPTRGGVATSLNELARDCGLGVVLFEDNLPVHDAVRGACELLGLDPLHIANEGQFLAIVAPDLADAALSALRSMPGGAEARIIGEVREQPAGSVLVTTRYGGSRIVDMLVGDPLPRIC